MLDVYYIPVEKIKKIKWEGDAKLYDTKLYNLGQDHNEFIIANPEFCNYQFYKNIKSLPLRNSNRCVVWKYEGQWIAKYFTAEWINEQKYWEVDLKLDWVKNPAIDSSIVFEDIIIQDWYDLNYEMTWYLDSRFNLTADKIWVAKCQLSNTDTLGTKDMGYVSPKITYNPDLPNLKYTTDERIPYYDLIYEHIWMIDDGITDNESNIWGAKITPTSSLGTKIAGTIKIDLPKQLDVIFISYNEPNAEENWLRVLEKAPHAFRVNGITGIVNAHKCAAELSTTDMFYVVDGDAYLTDDWNFKYQPNIFNRDCVHVWRSRNPINDLEYGYGGVKLIPKELMLIADSTNTDMTTSISSKFKIMDKISNITAFNTSEFNTWRSAFRECVKLSSNILKRQLSRESEKRLNVWCTAKIDVPFGTWAMKGAMAGRAFGQKHTGDADTLSLINNFEWLQNKFNELYINK